MKKHPSPRRSDRCLCGLRVALHYGRRNERLSCADARLAHRWAGIKFQPLREVMLRSLEVGR